MDFSDLSPAVSGEAVFRIVSLFIVLFLALLLHELGHFFMARLFGIKVKAVEIGYGCRVFEYQDRRGTCWRVGLVPFGARVDLGAGEGEFFTRPYWQRALTIMAGPLVNLALPFFLFTVFFAVAGQPSGPPVIVGIGKDLPAQQAGLKPGDRVLAVNGRPVLNVKDIWQEAYMNGTTKAVFKIRRGNKEFESAITPLWAEYMDDGIRRANPRFGIMWTHSAFHLRALKAVNGISVKGSIDKARDMLLKNMDKTVLITLKGTDDKGDEYYFRPRAAVNPDLYKKGSRNYKSVYLGPTSDNFYLHQPFAAQLQDAVRYSLDRIRRIALVPFQLLPIDTEAIRDEDAVGSRETFIKNHIYGFVHALAVASILIGLLNLLPLPYLDGGYIAEQGIEVARGAPLTPKGRAMLFGGAFLAIYLSILAANIDNLPRYIDSRLKKVQEFINQNHG